MKENRVAGVPSRAMTTILDTLSHSSLNSSIHLSTSSERKHTSASCASYTIRLDGRRTPCDDVFVVVAMRRPTSCCTCRSLTHVTTFGPFAFAPGAHQANGTTRMFGIAASHAAESRRTSDDWMSSAGMACESVLCKGPNTEGGPTPMEGLTGAAAAVGDGG
jgi:hypothetical protein